MKRYSRTMLLLAVLLLVALAPAQAQMKKVAQTGLQFMKIDMSARAAGMGGAYTMVGGGDTTAAISQLEIKPHFSHISTGGDDASALLYNAAGLVEVENIDFYASRTTWISDIAYNGAALVKNFGDSWGTFGVSVRAADYGEMIGTRVASNAQGFEETGEVDIGAYAVGLSYARRLSTRFSVGATVSAAKKP